MIICMRTTLDIDDALARAARQQAAQEGRPLTRLIEDALRSYLAPKSRSTEGFELSLLTKGGRTLPGVDLTDRDALYDLMNGHR